MGFLLVRKMTAARTRIWPANGCYMGLITGLFLKTGQIYRCISRQVETDDFAGVSGTAPDGGLYIKETASPRGGESESPSHNLSEKIRKNEMSTGILQR